MPPYPINKNRASSLTFQQNLRFQSKMILPRYNLFNFIQQTMGKMILLALLVTLALQLSLNSYADDELPSNSSIMDSVLDKNYQVRQYRNNKLYTNSNLNGRIVRFQKLAQEINNLDIKYTLDPDNVEYIITSNDPKCQGFLYRKTAKEDGSTNFQFSTSWVDEIKDRCWEDEVEDSIVQWNNFTISENQSLIFKVHERDSDFLLLDEVTLPSQLSDSSNQASEDDFAAIQGKNFLIFSENNLNATYVTVSSAGINFIGSQKNALISILRHSEMMDYLFTSSTVYQEDIVAKIKDQQARSGMPDVFTRFVYDSGKLTFYNGNEEVISMQEIHLE